MHIENELPKVTRDVDRNWNIPKQLVEVLKQTDFVAGRIKKDVRRNFRNQPDRDRHILASKYFLDLLAKSVAWGVNEGRWDSFNISLPTNDQKVHDIILRHLVDKNQQPIVLDKKQLGEGIKVFSYIPTVIPTLWVREIVSQVYKETITTRTISSQAAQIDLQSLITKECIN